MTKRFHHIPMRVAQSWRQWLSALATDASVFARLGEGDSVRYSDDTGAFRDATLIEKCLYGALVARVDGTIVAVGFRKLWPAGGSSA